MIPLALASVQAIVGKLRRDSHRLPCLNEQVTQFNLMFGDRLHTNYFRRAMSRPDARRNGWQKPTAPIACFLLPLLLAFAPLPLTLAGEPAEAFLNQLRAAGYFDLAIKYLDRLDTYPGVDEDLKSAVLLEKAQTYIDAGVSARQADQQDTFFRQAEQQLTEFLQAGDHPRQNQARLQLGRLQMVRAAQLHGDASDDAKKAGARESYLAAAKTFDTIVETLRTALKEMQGAKVDAEKNPEKAAQRDQFRGQFLEAIKNAGEARLLAAQTFDNPGTEAKEILEKSLETFTELSDKYESYVPGAVAFAYQGEVQIELGMKEKAIDSFIRMLEQPEVDALREAKFRASAGMIRVHMSASPPNYQAGIDAGEPISKDIRPNENTLPIVQSFRIELAKANLAKAADDKNQEAAAIRRARSAGRQLLVDASKVPGSQAAEAGELLKGMGIEVESQSTETISVDDPTDFQDALLKSRQLLTTNSDLKNSLNLLKKQAGSEGAAGDQIASVQAKMAQTQSDAIRILRIGMGIANRDTDPANLNQARQILAYLLYQDKQYRGAAVVGQFLARTAAGTEIGLQGGLLALNSLQLLLSEDSGNAGLAAQLQTLGTYLNATWPDDPKAAAAQGIMLRLALKGGDYEEANALIDKMPNGPEKTSSQRLMGRILWSDSFKHRKADKEAEAKQAVEAAERSLLAGLEGSDGTTLTAELLKSALALADIYLELDQVNQAADILEHPKFGPIPLIEKQDVVDQSFKTDLYSTELRVVVQLMTVPGSDPTALLDRASAVMEKLQASVEGPDAQKRLSATYLRMAKAIRDQLDRAEAGGRTKLVDAFRLFLERVAATTTQPATLQWAAMTLIELGESSMPPNAVKASGQSGQLLNTAVQILEKLKTEAKEPSLTIDFQLGRANRILGNYKTSIDTLHGLLTQKPMMLDAQVEAAMAYEQWAAVVPPKYAGNAYKAALNGARPNAEGENVIWGWGKIGQLTMGKPVHKTTFFDARYHVALSRFLWGKATKDERVIRKAVTDITRLHALHPDLGGDELYRKFDQLLQTIQTELKEQPVGLPKPK